MMNRRYLQPSKHQKNSDTNRSLLTLYQLGVMRSSIDIDQNQTLQIRQELKVQKNISNKILKSIDSDFSKVQNQASYYCRKLEQEKNKYHNLEVLVNHYQKIIMQKKIDNYQDQKNNIQTDQYVDLKNKLKQLERELQTYQLKVNASSYENKKKLDQVRSERSERAVFSGLFDKIQKQLFHLEFYYKQLALERSLVEKIYKQNFQEFNKIQHTANLNIEKAKQNSIIKTENFGQYSLSTHSCNIQNQKLPNYIPANRNKLSCKKHQDQHQKKATNRRKLSEVQLNKITWQKKFKNLTYQLGISSISQLKNQVQNLSFNLERSYQIVQQYSDEIIRMQSIINRKQSKKQIYQDNYLEILKQIKYFKQRNQALSLKIQEDNTQINQFNDNIHQIGKILLCSMQDKFETFIDLINQKILSICPPYSYTPYRERKVTKNLAKLDTILDGNRAIKTSMYLYTEQELIQLSRQKLIKQQGREQKPKLSKFPSVNTRNSRFQNNQNTH